MNMANMFQPDNLQVIHIITNKHHDKHTGSTVTHYKLLTAKNLGIFLRDYHSWHKHIDNVTAKAFRTLGFFNHYDVIVENVP